MILLHNTLKAKNQIPAGSKAHISSIKVDILNMKFNASLVQILDFEYYSKYKECYDSNQFTNIYAFFNNYENYFLFPIIFFRYL